MNDSQPVQPPAAARDDEAPADGETPAAPARFPIVGIGASAGGLAAFETFFAAMPAGHGTGMAFVLVQHLAPDHKSVLVDIVQRYTRMQVFEAADGLEVQPECTYIIPPNRHLRLEAGRLRLSEQADERKPRLTIDHFFFSLAKELGETAVCIVMSGTGTDGTLGLREIKGVGGMAIVQSPDSTEYDGMPRSAIATGLADYVLAPADMPAQLLAYARHAFDPARASAPPALRSDALHKLCVLLRGQSGHDFSQYKETTLVRRMSRRMALLQIDQPDDYLAYARAHPQEVDALFRDLLIGVTHFFRDPDAFATLETQVLPRLVAAKAAHDALRVWVCACSTGEEAYSIAILLHESMTEPQRRLKLQVFATDIDRQAIDQARSGIYPASIAAHVSEERLARCFTHDPQRGTYRIQKHIRDLVVFSEQDVIKDPPFSKLDLVCCRNLLIYLNADLQRKLIPLFHYALRPGGALFLGTSETVGESARLFSVVDRKWKLYFRLPAPGHDPRRTLPDHPPASSRRAAGPAALPAAEPGDEVSDLRQLTEKALLAHYAQAAVLVDARGQMLHIVGRTGLFFEPADGDASMNVLAMAREGLKRELTIALHKAVAHRELVVYRSLNVKTNGDHARVDLAVRTVDAAGGAMVYLVVLELQPARAPDEPAPQTEADAGRIDALERELRAKDEYLQTTLEEMQTTNEELKSTNEEMQSVNEELQSTNEELETSKEELQSVNEELSTVNAELQDRVGDLSRANDDMNNLLAGTGVGTLFVDNDLRIARFTPAATQVINLIAGDVGRPLAHVSVNLVGYDRMLDDIAGVLETLVPREAEVQVRSGAWYLMRIRPYRTTSNLIEGVVVTLVDVTERKRAEDALRRGEARLNVFINQAYAGVAETDLDGRFLFANDRLCETLGYARDELLTKRLADITEPEDLPQLRAMLADFAAGGTDTEIDKRYIRKDGQRVRMLERVSALRDASDQPGTLLALSFVGATG